LPVNGTLNHIRYDLHQAAHHVDSGLQAAVGTPPQVKHMSARLWLGVHAKDIGAGNAFGAQTERIKDIVGSAIYQHMSGIVEGNADEIRAQVATVVDLHAGTAVSNAVRDFYHGYNGQDRDHIIAGMFNAAEPSSALNRLVKRETEAALAQLAQQVADLTTRRGVAPSALELRELAAKAGASAADAWLDGQPKTLQHRRLMAEFGVALVDAHMQPRPEVALAHAKELLKEQVELRQKVSELARATAAGGPGALTPPQASAAFYSLMREAAKHLQHATSAGTIGLAPDQQRLLDHMNRTFLHKVEQRGANVGAAMSWLSLLNALIPDPSQGVARAGLGAARGAVTLVAQAASLSVLNAKAEQRYTSPYAASPIKSHLEKDLIRASSKQIGKMVDTALQDLDEAKMDAVLKPMIEAGTRRLALTLRLFPEPAKARDFLASNAGYVDELVQLKGQLAQQLKALQDGGGAPDRIGATEQALAALAGVAPNIGMAEITDGERFAGLMSFLDKSSKGGLPAGADPSALLREHAAAVAAALVDPQQRARADAALAKARDHAAAVAWDGADAHSATLVARQVGMESAPFRKLTDDLTVSVYQDHAADRAAVAERAATLTGVGAGALGSAATTVPVMLAGALAGGGIGGIVAGAVTQGVVAPMIGKAVRTMSHGIVTGFTEGAAASKLTALHADPTAKLPSAEQLAQSIQASWPSLSAQYRNGVTDVVRAEVQDNLATIVENRFQIGRLTLGALLNLEDNPQRKADLGKLLDFEEANQKLTKVDQLKTDLAGPAAVLAKHRERLTLAEQATRQPAGSATAALDKLSAVGKLQARLDKYARRESEFSPKLAEAGERLVTVLPALLDKLQQREAVPGLAPMRLSDNDWVNLEAVLLFPRRDPAIAAQLDAVKVALTSKGMLHEGGRSSLHAMLAKHVDPADKKAFQADLEGWQGGIKRAQENVAELVDEHRKYLRGDTADVQDRNHIYARWVHDYDTAQVEHKIAVTPEGTAAAAISSTLALGMMASLPLGTSAGFVPLAIGDTGKMTISGVGKVNPLASLTGALIPSMNPLAFAGSALSADRASTIANAYPDYMANSTALAAHGMDMQALGEALGGNLTANFKRSATHVSGVPAHPGAHGQPINFSGQLADRARSIERRGTVAQGIRDVVKGMNPADVIAALAHNMKGASIKETSALFQLMLAQQSITAAAAQGMRADGPDAAAAV